VVRRTVDAFAVWTVLAAITTVFWRLAVSASWSRAAGTGVVIALVAGVVDRVWQPTARPRLPWPGRPDVVWPYRPREGYPSAPAWLFVAVLAVAVFLVLALYAALDGSIR
jgi:hypothetical protein